MGKKKALKPVIACEDCIHEYACCAWTLGGRLATQNAEKCQFFETVRSSAAYLIGKMEADRWIPASEPPKEYRDECMELIPFLVCERGTEYPFRAFYDGKVWGDGWSKIPVTHWMPLPESPKEE